MGLEEAEWRRGGKRTEARKGKAKVLSKSRRAGSWPPLGSLPPPPRAALSTSLRRPLIWLQAALLDLSPPPLPKSPPPLLIRRGVHVWTNPATPQ